MRVLLLVCVLVCVHDRLAGGLKQPNTSRWPTPVRVSRAPLPQRHAPFSGPNKQHLAKEMKQNFVHYRNQLQQTINNEKQVYRRPSAPVPVQPLSRTDQFLAKYPPITFVTKKSSASLVDVPKSSRSAGEGPSGLRPSGLGLQVHPVKDKFPAIFLTNAASSKPIEVESTEDSDRKLLDSRLGPMSTFDPSIVVDFRLLSLSQSSQSAESKIVNRKSPTGGVTLTARSSTDEQIYRRRVPSSVSSFDQSLPTYQHKLEANQSLAFGQKHEPMAVYVDTRPHHPTTTTTAKYDHHQQFGDKTSEELRSSEADVEAAVVSSRNDFADLMLPQSVRDSLRKYLEPLLVALKPLTKSVPGLPGLDYPILSVVPYTNFYCSNMPWPGFYADTEARCQTWHACDVDGRQASFLCPNGTVFNQALMVCDWWYNADCLTAPFLYSLNERLFGHLKPQHVAPYRRITPQLLDTIFL